MKTDLTMLNQPKCKNTPATSPCRTAFSNSILSSLILTLLSASPLFAQPPIHDPSTTIRNTDGRYWHFATGDGIYTISSATADFASWRTEATVFPRGVWPSWIANYVSGFNGFFWAPDVIKIGSLYYCYYACAGTGAPAAIGLATASNLSGPWTDRGMIVAANNAIDPAMLIDGSNMYLFYGNWQSGIDLIQLNPSNGLRLNSNRWDIVGGEVEAPYVIKNGGFYYMFFQSGLCCNGVNSTYYTRVGRSSSITGTYVDQAGVSLLNGGGTTFLPNRNGRVIGPGHVGYGEGTLTYHFYDGNNNGVAKLMVNSLSWVNGWPVAGGTTQGQIVANGTYKLRNRTGGKYLDNIGATADGANVGQWASSASNNQRWVITFSGGFYKLRCVSGGKYLDNIGHTTDGSTAGQFTGNTNASQQWTITAAASPYFKIINRANGKALDNGGSTADGAFMQFWFVNPSNNQQWALELVSTSTSTAASRELVSESNINADRFSVSPNPVSRNILIITTYNKLRSNVKITLVNTVGQVVYNKNLGIREPGELRHDINMSSFSKGLYIVNLTSGSGTKTSKVIRE